MEYVQNGLFRYTIYGTKEWRCGGILEQLFWDEIYESTPSCYISLLIVPNNILA
jgi:hypothetical protein